MGSPQEASRGVAVGECVAHSPPHDGAQQDVDRVLEKDVAHIFGAPVAHLEADKPNLQGTKFPTGLQMAVVNTAAGTATAGRKGAPAVTRKPRGEQGQLALVLLAHMISVNTSTSACCRGSLLLGE